MKYLLAPLMLSLCSAAAAQELSPLTADEFDALTQGKTITYSQSGIAYGAEEYRPNRTVVWAFTDSECRIGSWYQQGEQICFDYHDEMPLQCWTFYNTGDGLIAQFAGDDTAIPLTALSESTTPLNCPAPDIGV